MLCNLWKDLQKRQKERLVDKLPIQMSDKEYQKWKKSLSDKEVKEKYPEIATELIAFRKEYPKIKKEITELRTVYQKLHARLIALEMKEG